MGSHYLNLGLTHSEAIADARDLGRRKQHAIVITRAAAERMIEQAVAIGSSSLPDMKF